VKIQIPKKHLRECLQKKKSPQVEKKFNGRFLEAGVVLGEALGNSLGSAPRDKALGTPRENPKHLQQIIKDGVKKLKEK
jgi:hypothetical protein